MSYSPPAYGPPANSPPAYGSPSHNTVAHSPSIWTRVLDWVHHLGVVVAAIEDLRPGVTVAVEDLRPRAKYVQITLDAVNDIRFCKMIFDHWMTGLDKVTSSSEKPDEREQRLRFYLGHLKKYAGLCSNATNEILQCHVRFASMIARRIDDASESQYKLKFDDSETTMLAKDISEASWLLSINATEMMYYLDSFVSALKEVQIAVKEEPSLAERTLAWLKYLFKAVVRILICPPISALPPSAEPKRQIPVSTLREGTATFFKADPEPQEGKVSESLDSVILFLKKIVPREVQNAQKNLQRFDEALDGMGLERHMRAGRRVTLYGPDPAAIAKKWRDIAEQYQLVLPDDEDLTFHWKKSCS